MNKFLRSVAVVAFVSGLGVGAVDAHADTKGDNACNMDDAAKVRAVIQFLHAANQAEIKLGKLAMSKSQNGEVKAFADHMVKDHTDADKKLEPLAGKKNVNLGATPTDPLYVATITMHDALATELGGKSGPAFDMAYIAGQPADHLLVLKVIEEGQKAAAKDPDAKKALDEAHAMVSAHKGHAEKTLSAMQAPKGVGGGPSK